MTAERRLLELLDGQRLTPVQRRIAQCLVEHSGRAAYLSTGDLAELADVSQPSVTRFAMALGFDGYPALRERLRGLDIQVTLPFGHQNPFQRALGEEIEHLRRLSDTLAGDGGPIVDAAPLLMASSPLLVLGLRASRGVATSFSYFAAKIHPDVRLLAESGSVLADRVDQARAAGAAAMLAFVLPRYPREAVDALREARAAGLTVVTITDSPVSPAAAVSDLVLAAAVGSQLVFDLHLAPMALVTMLLQAMCEAAPGPTQTRLESFERSAADRQVFLP
jgi:DNA-binding MurR/RpiR family transcriptional regulator